MLAALLLAAIVSPPQVAVAHRQVSTPSAAAQSAFDRGLTDLYAYAGGNASTIFYTALAADPHLAMAQWGITLAEGSDLNTPLTELRFGRSHDASLRAQAAKQYATPREAALIDAVALRYQGTYADSGNDENAYRTAMEKYVAQYPDDDDASMLLVEALLEDHGMQWNDDGTPRDDTSKEMLSLTNAVLARNPSHLMANHLCIHLYDAAPDREPATACATRLDAMTFAPQDEHLAHMPAHTWLERGDWRAAVASSERAYQLVATWAKASGQDITAAKYLRHDEYLGLSAAVLGGDLTAASQWSSRLNAFVPNGYDGAAGPHLTLAKGLASLRNGDRASAQADLDALRKAGLTEDVALLEARIDERDGKIDGALSALHRAQDWQRANLAPETLPLFPADERIGALQFRAGRYADAEATFRAVAKERPLAPRALYGLWQTLLERGNNEEAAAFADRFRTAWAGQYTLTMDDF